VRREILGLEELHRMRRDHGERAFPGEAQRRLDVMLGLRAACALQLEG